MTYSVYVFGHGAFSDKDHFERLGVTPLHQPEEVRVYGPKPKFVYAVEDGEFHKLTVEDAEVYRLVHDHPNAKVRMIPLVA